MSASKTNRRFAAVALVCAIVFAYELYAIFFVTHGAPANALRSGQYLAGEIAGEHVASQTFQLKTNGFSSITLYPAVFGQDADGNVVFELHRLGADERDRLVFQTSRPSAEVLSRSSLTLDFPALSDSDGGLFRIDVRMPDAAPGRGLGLWANRENSYRDGTLLVDGREQWGDLAFETAAPGATAFRHVQQLLSNQPSWLASPFTLALVFGFYNVALFAFVFSAMRQPGWKLQRTPSAASTHPRAAVAAASALIAALAVFTVWRMSSSGLESGAIDLIDRFPEAEKRTTMPTLHNWFDIVDVTIDGETKRSIYAAPSSRIIWRLEIPPVAVLRVSAALQPHVWTSNGDGALFRVGISDGAEYKEFVRLYLNPYSLPQDRRWSSAQIDLSPYAGRNVEVIFNTGPGEMGNGVSDASVWGAPRIVPNAAK